MSDSSTAAQSGPLPSQSQQQNYTLGKADPTRSSAAVARFSLPQEQQHPQHPSTAEAHNPPFDLDSFDFGADFSLPSSLDDLSIFHNGTASQHSPVSAQNDHASNASQKMPGASKSPHPRSHSAVRSSSNSTSGSPLPPASYSPRAAQHEHVMASSHSSAQPSPLGPATRGSIDATPGAGAGIGGSGSGTGNNGIDQDMLLSNNDLQDLLTSIQNVAATQQTQQQQQQMMHGGNLSLGELEKLLAEKEHVEQLQNQQTTFLRHQIETLQRQQQEMLNQQTSPLMPQGSQPAPFGALNASQLMQQFAQLGSVQHNDSGSYSSSSMGFGGQYPTSGGLQGLLQQLKDATDASNQGLMSQHGLFTPMSSGALPHPRVGSKPEFVSPLNIPSSSQVGSMDAQRMHELPLANGSFTPLESPAITPASVFSTAGSVATTTADIFSPLTSPALRPQMDGSGINMSPYYGPTPARNRARMGRHTPNASPAGPQPTKSVPRKNRSTTAEARANRARPSPLIKPVTNPTSAPPSQRKRTESSSGSTASPNSATILPGSSTAALHEAKSGEQSSSSKSATKNVAKSTDASSSENGASTPSPIEMPPPNGKPMTPSSVMGIKPKPTDSRRGHSSSASASSLPNLRPASSSKSKDDESPPAATKSVAFADAPQSPGSLSNILPSGLSKAEREAWISSMKSSGGLESRRTSHKAAEQKRRDSLKYCFDDLRAMLPPITLDDDVPGGSMLGPDGLVEDQDEEGFALEEVGDAEAACLANRAISKVALLRHSNEYLLRLKQRMMRRDRDLAAMRRENLELRARLGLPLPPEAPFWIGMGVGPMPPTDAAGLTDQYARVHLQQQVQMQMQMGQMDLQARGPAQVLDQGHGSSEAGISMDTSS